MWNRYRKSHWNEEKTRTAENVERTEKKTISTFLCISGISELIKEVSLYHELYEKDESKT